MDSGYIYSFPMFSKRDQETEIFSGFMSLKEIVGLQ